MNRAKKWLIRRNKGKSIGWHMRRVNRKINKSEVVVVVAKSKGGKYQKTMLNIIYSVTNIVVGGGGGWRFGWKRRLVGA